MVWYGTAWHGMAWVGSGRLKKQIELGLNWITSPDFTSLLLSDPHCNTQHLIAPHHTTPQLTVQLTQIDSFCYIVTVCY